MLFGAEVDPRSAAVLHAVSLVGFNARGNQRCGGAEVERRRFCFEKDICLSPRVCMVRRLGECKRSSLLGPRSYLSLAVHTSALAGT
jgi:hypothetical protein